MTPEWANDLGWLALTALLVVLNGFFVAAEFALVKVRAGQIETMSARGRAGAATARWLMHRLDGALSVCQLGITVASLGLGWIGEPALARLIEPALDRIGIAQPAVVHTIAFVLAFGTITALHIVIGEQVPKIYAIRRPGRTALGIAAPLKLFYFVSYPLMVALNGASSWMLRRLGLGDGGGHEPPHSEAEIRALLRRASAQGELTPAEHVLLEAIFDFDDQVARRVMVPRLEVAFLDVGAPLAASLAIVKRTRHSRYPVCRGSLDEVLGILHVKDLVGVELDGEVDLETLSRPAMQVPETMAISALLRAFQHAHQLMALVVDELGTLVGVVTLENVLEQIVGPVADEFDDERPDVVAEGPGRYRVRGGAPIEVISRRLGLEFEPPEEAVDTVSGLLTVLAGRLLETGDRLEIGAATAEVLDAAGGRALQVRVQVPPDEHDEAEHPPVAPA